MATIVNTPTVKEELQNLLKESRQANEAAVNYLRHNGVELSFDEWLTPKKYAEKFNVSLQVVQNWINRGIVPAENIRVVEELNDLKLIKAVPYK